jgi:plastocyanin
MSFGNWNDVAISKNGLYVACVGDYHNFYTNYNTNYNVFSQLYTVPTVELVGGSGTAAYSGDGGTVFRAQFTATLGDYIFRPNGYYITNSQTIRFVNNQSIITTVCGTNTASTTGNFGLATSATINNSLSTCEDTSKNYLYVSEFGGNVVRRIDKNGIISPFCGTGTASSTGDGGPATLATINKPWGILCDLSNNIYIFEDTGARIRKTILRY